MVMAASLRLGGLGTVGGEAAVDILRLLALAAGFGDVLSRPQLFEALAGELGDGLGDAARFCVTRYHMPDG